MQDEQAITQLDQPGATGADEPAGELAVSTGDAIIPLTDFLALGFGQLGIVIALFGALLTVIVIFFALKTKEAAVAEVKGEMADIRAENVKLKSDAATAVNEAKEKLIEARTDMLGLKDSIKDQVNSELKSTREEVKNLEYLLKDQMLATQKEKIELQQELIDLRDNLKQTVDEAVAKAKEFDSTLAKMKSGEWIEDMVELLAAKPELSREAKVNLSLRSSAVVEEKHVAQYTRSDFLTVIAHHLAERNWDTVDELTDYMKESGANDEIRALGFFYSGKNHFASQRERSEGKMDYRQLAEADYLAAIEKFSGSSNQEVRLTVAKCRNNLIVVYLRKDGYEKAIELAEEALKHLDGLKPDDVHRLKAKILINHANALSHLDKNEEAIEAYQMVIRNLLHAPDFPGKEDRIGLAYYNMACAWALLKDVEASIECLKKGHSHSDTALSDLPTDEDFDGIRQEKSFTEFLDDYGFRPSDRGFDFGGET
ncbi:MAG: hypothetical protein QNJ15_02925 [Erythrobacter sp.]|nr:hypothetical protein [Erythrobacter sp.]